jgi:hypothetical protein
LPNGQTEIRSKDNHSEQHIGGYLSLARQNPQCERYA